MRFVDLRVQGGDGFIQRFFFFVRLLKFFVRFVKTGFGFFQFVAQRGGFCRALAGGGFRGGELGVQRCDVVVQRRLHFIRRVQGSLRFRQFLAERVGLGRGFFCALSGHGLRFVDLRVQGGGLFFQPGVFLLRRGQISLRLIQRFPQSVQFFRGRSAVVFLAGFQRVDLAVQGFDPLFLNAQGSEGGVIAALQRFCVFGGLIRFQGHALDAGGQRVAVFHGGVQHRLHFVDRLLVSGGLGFQFRFFFARQHFGLLQLIHDIGQVHFQLEHRILIGFR